MVCDRVTVPKEMVGMSCAFHGTCGCGYQFVSSNVNLVWKRQLHGGVQISDPPDVNEADTTTQGNAFVIRYDTIRQINVRSKADEMASLI